MQNVLLLQASRILRQIRSPCPCIVLTLGILLFSGANTDAISSSSLSPDQPHALLAKGRWWLVTYLEGSSSREISHAVYLDLLARRFSKLGLSALVIVADDVVGLSDQLMSRQLGIAVVPVREARDLQGLIANDRDHNVWLIDPTGNFRFCGKGSVLAENDLRQIVEKVLGVGVSRFDPATARPLATGDLLPEVWVEDVRTSERLKLRCGNQGEYSGLLYFVPNCISCGVGGQLETLGKAVKLFGNAGRRVAVVFSSRFSAVEISSRESLLKTTIPIFIAHEELEGVEDLYYAKSLLSEEIFVTCDARGAVESLVLYSDLVQADTPGAER